MEQKTLMDFITFGGRHLEKLTESGEIKQLIDLAIKLVELEGKIVQCPEGVIDIHTNGVVLTMLFPADLQEQIQKKLVDKENVAIDTTGARQ